MYETVKSKTQLVKYGGPLVLSSFYHPISFILQSIKYFRSRPIGLNRPRDQILYPRIFKTARDARNKKKKNRVVNAITSIWREHMLGYLSLDIICSSKITVFLELRSRKTVRFSEQIMSTDKYSSIFFFLPNGGFCRYILENISYLSSHFIDPCVCKLYSW